jgi:hypothetical protein
MLRLPGAGGQLQVKGDRVGVPRGCIPVGEVVDEVGHADGVLGRQGPLVDAGAGVGVSGSVHGRRDGREGVGVADRLERVVLEVLVALGRLFEFSAVWRLGRVVERSAVRQWVRELHLRPGRAEPRTTVNRQVSSRQVVHVLVVRPAFLQPGLLQGPLVLDLLKVGTGTVVSHAFHHGQHDRGLLRGIGIRGGWWRRLGHGRRVLRLAAPDQDAEQADDDEPGAPADWPSGHDVSPGCERRAGRRL